MNGAKIVVTSVGKLIFRKMSARVTVKSVQKLHMSDTRFYENRYTRTFSSR